jgi:hypothetical protein
MFLVSASLVKGSDKDEPGIVVDCYELEELVTLVLQILPKKKNGFSLAAAVSTLWRKKMEGFLVNC